MLRLALTTLASVAAYRILQENGLIPKSSRHLPDPSPRTGKPEHVEEQLDRALEDSFPASDPPSMTSPTVAGSAKIIGTDEVLRRKRQQGKGTTSG